MWIFAAGPVEAAAADYYLHSLVSLWEKRGMEEERKNGRTGKTLLLWGREKGRKSGRVEEEEVERRAG